MKTKDMKENRVYIESTKDKTITVEYVIYGEYTNKFVDLRVVLNGLLLASNFYPFHILPEEMNVEAK